MLQAIESIVESSDASYINVFENTGIYKSVNPFQNLTGWGAPNILLSQVTYAQLQVKFPDPVCLLPQQNFYIFPTTLNYLNIYVAPDPGVTNGFPNVVNEPYQITASSIGIGNTFPVGIYEFLLTYGGSWGNTLYQWRMRQVLIQPLCCCVKELQSRIKQGCCEGQQYDDWMQAEIALQAVISDMNCLKQNRTAEAMQRLMDICNRNKCSCK